MARCLLSPSGMSFAKCAVQMLVMGAILLLSIHCGGGGGDDGERGCPDVAGAWTGTIDDTGAGVGTIDLSFAQDECALSGLWTTTFGSSTMLGSFTGTADGTILHATLTAAVPEGTECVIELTGGIADDENAPGTDANLIEGNHLPANCPGLAGPAMPASPADPALVLVRTSSFTPTPTTTPTTTEAPTPTPTATP